MGIPFVKVRGEKIEVKNNILNLSDRGIEEITEIEGLEKLFNLKELDLSYNHITEIKKLEKLTNLQELYLSENRILEIKGLEMLINLAPRRMRLRILLSSSLSTPSSFCRFSNTFLAMSVTWLYRNF